MVHHPISTADSTAYIPFMMRNPQERFNNYVFELTSETGKLFQCCKQYFLDFCLLNEGYYVKLCKSRQTPLDVGTKEKDDSQTPLKKVGFSWKSLKFVDSRSKLCIQVIILKREPTPPCLFKGSLFVKDKNCPHGLVNQDNFSEMKIGRLQRFYLKCDPSKREGELDSWRDFFWPTVLFCFCRRGFVLFWPTAAAIRKFSLEDPLFLSGDSREVILHLIERGEYFFNVFFPFWISFSLWVVGKEYPWAFLEDLWHTVTKPPDGFYQYLTHSTFQLLPIHPRTLFSSTSRWFKWIN